MPDLLIALLFFVPTLVVLIYWAIDVYTSNG